MDLKTRRLEFTQLTSIDLHAFHALVVDPHVLAFLMDGQTMDLEWCAAQIEASDALNERWGAGLFLVHEREGSRDPIGFAGFHIFPELSPEPQLLYALLPAFTGKAYATEIAVALVDLARGVLSVDRITAAVDEPNRASVRVLEKAGFVVSGEAPGEFGKTILFEQVF